MKWVARITGIVVVLLCFSLSTEMAYANDSIAQLHDTVSKYEDYTDEILKLQPRLEETFATLKLETSAAERKTKAIPRGLILYFKLTLYFQLMEGHTVSWALDIPGPSAEQRVEKVANTTKNLETIIANNFWNISLSSDRLCRYAAQLLNPPPPTRKTVQGWLKRTRLFPGFEARKRLVIDLALKQQQAQLEKLRPLLDTMEQFLASRNPRLSLTKELSSIKGDLLDAQDHYLRATNSWKANHAIQSDIRTLKAKQISLQEDFNKHLNQAAGANSASDSDQELDLLRKRMETSTDKQKHLTDSMIFFQADTDNPPKMGDKGVLLLKRLSQIEAEELIDRPMQRLQALARRVGKAIVTAEQMQKRLDRSLNQVFEPLLNKGLACRHDLIVTLNKFPDDDQSAPAGEEGHTPPNTNRPEIPAPPDPDSPADPEDQENPDNPPKIDKRKVVRLEIEATHPPLVKLDTPPYLSRGLTLDAVFMFQGEVTSLKAVAHFDDGSKEDVSILTKPPSGPPPTARHTTWSSPSVSIINGHLRADTTGLHEITAEYFSTIHGDVKAKILVEVAEPPRLKVRKDAIPTTIPAGVDTKVTYTFLVENPGSPTLHNITISDPDCSPIIPRDTTIPYVTGKTMFQGDVNTFTCETVVNGDTTNRVTVEGDYSRPGHGRPLTVRATDSVTVSTGSAAADNKGPETGFTSHSDGEIVDQQTIELRGFATDNGQGDNGIFMVILKSGTFHDQIYHVDLDASPTKSGDRRVNWKQKLVLKPGSNVITVKGYDNSPRQNGSTQSITITFTPPLPSPVPDAAQPGPIATTLVITPAKASATIGKTVTFTAWLISTDGSKRDVTDEWRTFWEPDNTITPVGAGTITITATYEGLTASATVKTGAPDITRDPAGPSGGKWNILFKPDGTDRLNCFKFMLATIGGERVASPGVLTPKATREGWSIDSAGGAGPYAGWSWTDPKQANARMTELSVYGSDWYGCRQPAKAQPPKPGVGQVSPLPPGVTAYGLWRKHHFIDPPDCYQFHSAPMTEAAKMDGREKWIREPNFFGPYAKQEVNAVMSNLSRYGGDYYGCLSDDEENTGGSGGHTGGPSDDREEEYYIVRVSGSGFIPNYGGSSIKKRGYKDFIVMVRPDRGKTLIEQMAEIRENWTRPPNCEPVISDRLALSKGPPRFWDSPPKVQQNEGPLSRQQYIETGGYLAETWALDDSEGPLCKELFKQFCGDPGPCGDGADPGQGVGTGQPGEPGTGAVGRPGGGDGSSPGHGVVVNPDLLNPDKQPIVVKTIQDWLAQAKPPQSAVVGSRWRYDKFGRMIGSGPGMRVVSSGTHDSVDYGGVTPESAAWSLRKGLDSIDHCTLEEYVVAKLGQKSISHCAGRYGAVKDLKGIQLAEAKAAVTGKGFTPSLAPGSPAKTPDEEGAIEKQIPGPEQYLKKGDTVKLYVHSPFVQQSAELPDFTNKPLNEAKKWLQKSKLDLQLKPGNPAPTGDLSGAVQSQSPDPGYVIAAGTKVVLTVYSNYVEARRVPNVIELSYTDVKNRLDSAGLALTSRDGGRPPSRPLANTAKEQRPLPGTEISAGLSVSVWFYSEYIQTREEQIRDYDCSGVSNSYAAWDDNSNGPRCFCLNGFVSDTPTSCISQDVANQKSCTQKFPGTFPAGRNANGNLNCVCSTGLIWDKRAGGCVPTIEKQVADADCSAFPGSIASWDNAAGKPQCTCPSPLRWNLSSTRCVTQRYVDQEVCTQNYPGSMTTGRNSDGSIGCDCPGGYIWTRGKTACVKQQPIQRTNTPDKGRQCAMKIGEIRNFMIAAGNSPQGNSLFIIGANTAANEARIIGCDPSQISSALGTGGSSGGGSSTGGGSGGSSSGAECHWILITGAGPLGQAAAGTPATKSYGCECNFRYAPKSRCAHLPQPNSR